MNGPWRIGRRRYLGNHPVRFYQSRSVHNSASPIATSLYFWSRRPRSKMSDNGSPSAEGRGKRARKSPRSSVGGVTCPISTASSSVRGSPTGEIFAIGLPNSVTTKTSPRFTRSSTRETLRPSWRSPTRLPSTTHSVGHRGLYGTGSFAALGLLLRCVFAAIVRLSHRPIKPPRSGKQFVSLVWGHG